MSGAFEKKVSPEILAGGYSKRDGTIEFYSRINSLIQEDMTILDFGAGRGVQFEDTVEYRRKLRVFKGRVDKVIGCDVDPIVSTNPGIDEAVEISPNERLPFEDGVFDLIMADWVLEHIEDPTLVSAEMHRILKPGGWFCARTPCKWSYVALGASLVPNKLHGNVLQKVQPEREEEDVFKKYYKMNSIRELAVYFPSNEYINASYYYNSDPAYHGGSMLLYKILDFYQNIPLNITNTALHAFFQKHL